MVSGIMLALLFIDIFTMAFNIQSVRASGTIYIRADGSIDPLTAPISTVDNVTYTLIDNINDSIVIERDNVVLDGAGYSVQGTWSEYSKGIDLHTRNNVTIKNTHIKGFWNGIEVDSSSNNTIIGNHATQNYESAIYLVYSSNNYIIRNNITANRDGIDLRYSSNNNVSENYVTANNGYGIFLISSNYNNNVTGNIVVANKNPGIWLEWLSNGNMIENNTVVSNKGYGVGLYASSENTIVENNIVATKDYDGYGIALFDNSHYNVMSGNNVTNNIYGVYLSYSSNNRIFHNNFVRNLHQTFIDNSLNYWDDGYPSGGNFWSDYNGTDLYSGPYQNETGCDGIGDTPYIMDENNRDNYPLTKPFGGWMLGDLDFDLDIDEDDLWTFCAAFIAYWKGH